ncbi:MAG TPA: stage III sporulation protein AG [Candidatus Mediterraneibacter pullistercoris]|nr:stage III sporulation protein AG [Candidatus Mediterraneibacter pullistercoris]
MDSKKLKDWIGKLRSGEKLPRKDQLLILLLVGILLLVIVFPSPSGGAGDEEDADRTVSAGNMSAEAGLLGEYEAYLEEKTAGVLKEVEGVGEVTVMITLKSGGQKIIEKDQASSVQTTSEEDSSGGTRTTEDTSSDKTSVYAQEADGSSTPYVSKELSPEIEGVVVIADGGGDAVTAQNITEAVQALFGVEAHKIKIMKRA